MGSEDQEATLRQLDDEIVRLLNRRIALARQVAREASDAASPGGEPAYVPEREVAVLERIVAANGGPLTREALQAIFREILSASRNVARSLRVAYLGPIATYSYEAARRHFGSSATLVPCRTIGDVFLETQRREVDYGVVPTENSTEGAVTHTLDRFLEFDLQICAEVELPIRNNLLSHGRLDQIARVYSHPQALAQCRRWLAEHLPRAAQIETTSTAAAAQLARDPDSAAIAPESASEIYGVPIVARRIDDVATNVTRFLVIGPHASGRSGSDRTAIVFSVDDRAGALCAALQSFAECGINLSRIESRPSRRRLWDYVFFVDLDGHPDDEEVARALDRLRRNCSFVRILGSWPVASPPARSRGTNAASPP